MRNLSRILDFISHLEVQEEEIKERRRERGSKEWKEEGRGVNIVQKSILSPGALATKIP